MPTYQYACTECGHRFEQYQSFSEDALTVCGECGGRLRKVFNSVGVTFKGSGFYRTDSRSGSAAKESTGSASGSSDAAGSAPASGSKDSGSTPSTSTPSSSPSSRNSSD